MVKAYICLPNQYSMSKENSTTEKTVSLKQIEDEIRRHVKMLRKWELHTDKEAKSRVVGMWNLLERLERLQMELTKTEKARTITLGEIEEVIVEHREILDEMGFLTDQQSIANVVGMMQLLKMLRDEKSKQARRQ